MPATSQHRVVEWGLREFTDDTLATVARMIRTDARMDRDLAVRIGALLRLHRSASVIGHLLTLGAANAGVAARLYTDTAALLAAHSRVHMLTLSALLLYAAGDTDRAASTMHDAIAYADATKLALASLTILTAALIRQQVPVSEVRRIIGLRSNI